MKKSIRWVVVPILMAICLTDISPGTANAAAPFRAPPSLAQLLEGIAADNEKMREFAMARLLRAGPKYRGQITSVRNRMTEVLAMSDALKSQDEAKALVAVRYFTKYRAAGYLALALSNSNLAVWMPAVKSLSKLKDKSVLPHVLLALEKINYCQDGSEEATVHVQLKGAILDLAGTLSGNVYSGDVDDLDSTCRYILLLRKRR